MISRFQAAVGMLLAVAMLVILISPAVASAPTTACVRHSVMPLLVGVILPPMPLLRISPWHSVRELLAIAHAPDLVDLTSARLC